MQCSCSKGQDGKFSTRASCRPGVNVTFYDLDNTQAQSLAFEAPVKHGLGDLLGTLNASGSMIVPHINFGPASMSALGMPHISHIALMRKLNGWRQKGLFAKLIT